MKHDFTPYTVAHLANRLAGASPFYEDFLSTALLDFLISSEISIGTSRLSVGSDQPADRTTFYPLGLRLNKILHACTTEAAGMTRENHLQSRCD